MTVDNVQLISREGRGTPKGAMSLVINKFDLTKIVGGFKTYIRFDPIVDIYKSRLEVNIFTLFIRLGGIIGFCKNLLWVILLSGSVVSLWRKIIPQSHYLTSSKSVKVAG